MVTNPRFTPFIQSTDENDENKSDQDIVMSSMVSHTYYCAITNANIILGQNTFLNKNRGFLMIEVWDQGSLGQSADSGMGKRRKYNIMIADVV